MPDGIFVGREPELATLRSAFSRARTGGGSTVVVSGEPGIGKSRLAHEFCREAEAAGASIAWGRAYEGPWSPPLTPWTEILDQLVTGPDIAPDLARSLVQILPQLGERAAGIELVPLSPEQERFRLFDAINRFLAERSARNPLILVLDDLQWADASSLDLARHLAYFAPKSAIVLVLLERTGEAERPPAVADLITALRSDRGASIISLAGLSPADVAQMVGAGTPLNSQLSASLALQTSGNPFFIEEMIRNVVADVDASPRLNATTLEIPEGVRMVVDRRLQRLSEPTRILLQNASIFPNGVDFPVLVNLTGMPEDELLNAIDEALAANLIVPVHGNLERYDFVHAIVRQTLAESSNPSRRVRLHRKAAEAIESVYAGREHEVAAELAVQYHKSATLPGAGAGLAYALAAADAARRNLANDQVVTFLQIARDLSSDVDSTQQSNILGQLAIAEAETLQIETSLQTLDSYLASAESAALPSQEIAETLNSVARALKYSAYADERDWRPVVERGLRLTSPDDGRIWARLMLLLDPVEPRSRAGIRAGRWLGFDGVATGILRQTGDEDDYARSVESFDPVSRSATDAYLTRVRGWTSTTAVMYGLTVAANHLQYRHGAFRDAHRLWLELIERSEKAGAIHWEQQATNQLTYLTIAEGNFEEAQHYEERSNALAARLGPGQNPAGHQLEMATCRAIYQGTDWREIATTWRTMLDDPALGPHDLSTLTGAYYGGLAAYCAAHGDDHAGARRILELLNPILEQMTPADCNHNGAVAFATGAAWKIGDGSAAPMYRKLASELIAAGVGDYPQTSTHLALAQAAAMMDRRNEALEGFDLALRNVRESGQLPLVPVVQFTRAEALTRWGNPDDLKEVLTLGMAARAGFETFAMAPWLIDLQVLLEGAEAKFGKGQQLPGAITEREADVLKLIARGYSDRQISDELFVSPRTVNAHVRNILGKANAANRVELAMWARSNGIVSE